MTNRHVQWDKKKRHDLVSIRRFIEIHPLQNGNHLEFTNWKTNLCNLNETNQSSILSHLLTLRHIQDIQYVIGISLFHCIIEAGPFNSVLFRSLQGNFDQNDLCVSPQRLESRCETFSTRPKQKQRTSNRWPPNLWLSRTTPVDASTLEFQSAPFVKPSSIPSSSTPRSAPCLPFS